ncbi:MAG: anhydro-N-acetylmuramic acid kinase, partial [Planctomycetota bacterium]
MKHFSAVGLMSGTSADGVSAAWITVGETVRLRSFCTYPFPRAMQRKILELKDGTTVDVCRGNVQVGELFAEAALKFLRRVKPKPDVIGSHGQTVYHVPGRASLQIGEPSVIAERTGITTVADFRPRDIAAGGEGAPLVPYFDEFVFGGGKRRAMQNIGGIANVTYVGEGVKPIAFDTGPGNALIDEAARMISNGRVAMDRNGDWAAGGMVDRDMLRRLMRHPYLRKPPPKSTGREEFSRRFLDFRCGREIMFRGMDAVATLTYFTAKSIADAYRRFLPPMEEVIVSGGGALNRTIMRRLRELLQPVPVVSIRKHGFDPLAKEPAAFALLGLQAVRGIPNCLGHGSVLGKIVPGRNYDRLMRKVRVPAHRFDRHAPEEAVRRVEAGAGGVLLFLGSVFEVPGFVNSLQRRAKFPLLVCADFEDGVGQQVRGATVLPSNMAVGATGSEELAYRKGKVTALEARALGVPWIFAPVVDLQSNPRNPIISTRAFGEERELVTRMAHAFIRGIREGGGLNCAKHFPGHGDVTVDSHLELPVMEHDEALLRERELGPYVDLRGEIDSVMTGHLLVRAFDADEPVTFSRKITHGLLREEIGFDGLIATDALIMGGVKNLAPEPEVLARAANAGADMLLFPQDPDAASGLLVEAVKAGKVSEERVDDAVGRIFRLKERAGLFRERITEPERIEAVVGCDEHRGAAREIAEAAVTKVRDAKSLLPLSGKATVAIVGDEKHFNPFLEEIGRHLDADRGEPSPDRPCVVAVSFEPRAFQGK